MYRQNIAVSEYPVSVCSFPIRSVIGSAKGTTNIAVVCHPLAAILTIDPAETPARVVIVID